MKAYLFDLDGTLVDTKADVAFAINETLRTLNLPPREEAFIFDNLGYGPGSLITSCMGEGHDEETLSRGKELFTRIYFDHPVVHTELYPGMDTVLTHLKELGKLAIVTNKAPLHTENTVQILGIGHWFDYVWAKSDAVLHKPDPLPLLETLDELELTPSDAFIIGDSETDIVAGQAASITTVGVTWGYRSRAQLEALAPDYIVETRPELLSLLRSLS